ncbi:hypothetical protein C8F04DRAFT_458177 [Mycena alexandri]|uniref:Uncharacterized protein n=1 Tax=Mycena alexandri TaxID=1745969 RepID=A0AAD6T089_9AGAR|nr:hypothetical protein C8F04DRAFT_458177 [Mycena alexandri]
MRAQRVSPSFPFFLRSLSSFSLPLTDLPVFPVRAPTVTQLSAAAAFTAAAVQVRHGGEGWGERTLDPPPRAPCAPSSSPINTTDGHAPWERRQSDERDAFAALGDGAGRIWGASFYLLQFPFSDMFLASARGRWGNASRIRRGALSTSAARTSAGTPRNR